MNIDCKSLRKFFVSYWLLHSALYNFAQGLENQRNRRFTWAITNYYYCMVYIGRLFMFLTKDLYFTGHSDLAGFFKGNNVTPKQNKKKNKIEPHNNATKFEDHDFKRIPVFGNPNEEINDFTVITINEISECIGWDEEKIKKFGEILENLKKFREENTYEAFIIYAQENHIVLTDFIMSATDGVRNIVEGYLKEACKVFFNYWRNKSEDIIKLLGHEWLILRTLETLKMHNLPYNDIEVIIKRGFFFENSEIYSSNNLEQINRIIKDTLSTSLSLRKKFENVCKFSNFDAKGKIANEALKTFKKLIEINKDNKERSNES